MKLVPDLEKDRLAAPDPTLPAPNVTVPTAVPWFPRPEPSFRFESNGRWRTRWSVMAACAWEEAAAMAREPARRAARGRMLDRAIRPDGYLGIGFMISDRRFRSGGKRRDAGG